MTGAISLENFIVENVRMPDKCQNLLQFDSHLEFIFTENCADDKKLGKTIISRGVCLNHL